MRILQINKYFYLRGGSERYLFEVCRLLEEAGHDVAHLAMSNPRNEPSPFSEFFLPDIDYRDDLSTFDRIRLAGKVIWNGEAFKRTKEIVRRFRPDVAHLHNIAHQLSGSVVRALVEEGVPILQSLHDYKLICPNYRLFRDGKPCDSCFPHRYWNAVRYKCLLGSRAASLVAAAEATAYSLTGLYRKGIDLYHSPSLFLKETMVKWGIDGERIIPIPLTIDIDQFEPCYEDDGYFLFAGRLSHEKGLGVLIEAARARPDVKIVVAGEGPERGMREEEATRYGLDRIRFAGHLGTKELGEAMRRCRALLLPSEYDDNSPVVMYEAFAFGKPVIGAARGGIPEMVVDGETGILVRSGDSEELAGAIAELADHPDRARKMGREARKRMETIYSPATHRDRLLELYERMINE